MNGSMSERSRNEAARKSPSVQPDQQNPGQDGSSSLLQSLETNVEDLRMLITCRVCIRPLYEPYTISCGHTFCYSCLRQWFDRDRAKKTCPDCRAKVVKQPAPAYLVRDMTQIFITRAELLPSGETTEDHRKLLQEEAEIIERDKKSTGSHRGGLFRGCFEYSIRPNVPPIRDLEDGVDRCPRCAWELEDGFCHSCGLQASEIYPMSGSESPGLSYFTGELISSPYSMNEGREYPESPTVSVSEESFYGDLENSDDSDHLTRPVNATEVGLTRRTARRLREAQNARPNTHDEVNRYAPAPPYSDISTEDEFGNTDEYSADEDDDIGSLDGFVVNDVEERPSSVQQSPRSSRYDTDEVTGIIDHFGSYSPDENDIHGEESAAFLDTQSDIINPPYLTDDSDESPLQRRGRRFHQRSPSSSRRSPSGEPDSTDSGIPPRPTANCKIRRQAIRRPRGDHSSFFSHPAAGERELSSEGRRRVPIEVDSESDPPPPVLPRPRRRRGVINRVISDDDDIEASVDDVPGESRQSSSGTATVGRKSPSQVTGGSRITQRLNQTADVPSPIVINSSPTRSEANASGRYSYRAPPVSLDNGFRVSPLRVQPSSSNVRSRNRPRAHARQYRRDLSRSPVPPSIAPPPIFARSIRDQSQSETNEAHQHAIRTRATRRAEREALKSQKRKRERERGTLDPAASRPPT